MNKAILAEINFFISLFICGAILLLIYDIFVILRNIVKHPRILVSIEDLIFWISAGFFVFGVIYEKNHGTIRWYSIVGMGLGMYIYHELFSNAIVHFFTFIIKKILHIIQKILNLLFRPVRFLYKKSKKLFLFIAKKLRLHCKKRGKQVHNFVEKQLKKLKEKVKIKRDKKKARRAAKKAEKEKIRNEKSLNEAKEAAVQKSPKGSFELIRQPEEKGDMDETHKKKKKRT